MKKIFWGLFTSIVLVSAGLFCYNFEQICYTSARGKFIGPFSAKASQSVYCFIPLHWAYIFIGLGIIPFLISLYLYYREHSPRKIVYTSAAQSFSGINGVAMATRGQPSEPQAALQEEESY